MTSASSPFTVLLLGRTGMGKSTTGNKLLNAVTGDNPWGNRRIKQVWPWEEEGILNFETSHAAESGTKHCKLLISKREDGEVRVVDTEGFGGSDFSDDVHGGNIRIAKEIERVAVEHKLTFDRILYFLPKRGKLERADGTLQEEIGVMWEFFGEGIFMNMVLVSTQIAEYPLSFAPKEKDVPPTFSVAMRLALARYGESNPPPCPPVVFIPLEGDTAALLSKIKGVDLGDKRFKPQVHKKARSQLLPTTCPVEDAVAFKLKLTRIIGSMAAAKSSLTVLLVGRSGMGKSTTGNKLLNAVTKDNPNGNSKIRRLWPQEELGSLSFESDPSSPESVTSQCSLLSSQEDGEIRVLNSVGFDGIYSMYGDVHLGNLQVVREIARVSAALDLSFDKVLYFLPSRGRPEKADGTMQEEIGVLWHCFGEAIFKNMVVVSTLQGDIPSQYAPDASAVQSIFGEAMGLAMKRHGVNPPSTPSALFIPMDIRPSDLLRKVRNTPIRGGKAFKPQLREDVCGSQRCSVDVLN